MIFGNFFNPHIERKTVVSQEDCGLRLDYYLSNRFSYYSRNEWRSLIESALLKLNDKKVSYKKKIKKNDVVSHIVFYLKEPHVENDVKILYDDKDLIIVNKPPNLPVIPAGKYYYNTLYTIICKKLGDKLKLLNRIDRETSGCIALSRTSETARKFCKMITNGKIKKIYLAIVENAKDIKDNFTVVGYMTNTPHKYYRRFQTLTDIKENNKYSKTKFRVVQRNGDFALVLCRLYTGRMHQIRVHLRSVGCYIVGDKIYGKEGPILFEKFVNPGGYAHKEELLDRQALHSYKIIFNHPKTGEKLRICAPLPNDMKILLKKLGL